MAADSIDISQLVDFEGVFPYPRWPILYELAATRFHDTVPVWTEIARQWSDFFAQSLGSAGHTVEGPNFLLTASLPLEDTQRLTRFAEECRVALQRLLPGIAEFRAPGKEVVFVLSGFDAYYSYVAPYYPDEGDYGGSGGMHIREGYPHTVLQGARPEMLQMILAHELMHAALLHLDMPAWIEEGLAQMFEADMTPRPPVQLDASQARRLREHWRRVGLNGFWMGEAFLVGDEGAGRAHQLAEILIRDLVSEHRPRWFGVGRSRVERLFAFLRTAKAVDGGTTAAAAHLNLTLGELAARFLGPGEWEPPV